MFIVLAKLNIEIFCVTCVVATRGGMYNVHYLFINSESRGTTFFGGTLTEKCKTMILIVLCDACIHTNTVMHFHSPLHSANTIQEFVPILVI